MCRVLVIDNSAIVSMSVRSILNDDGHEVRWLGKFVDLPKCFSEYEPDLILLSLNVSGVSGTEFVKYVRNNQKKNTRILIHSSQPPEEIAPIVKELGAAGVVAKGLIYKEQLRNLVKSSMGT